MWAALLGRVLGERLPARAWVGVGVCLAGVLLITGVDVSWTPARSSATRWRFAGGVFGGVYIVTGGFVRRDLNTLAYTVICYGACAVLLLGRLPGRRAVAGGLLRRSTGCGSPPSPSSGS